MENCKTPRIETIILGYFKHGIITIPLNLTDGKPMVDVEMLSIKELDENDICEMFQGLDMNQCGIGILKDNLSGHFEGIRFKGKSNGFPAILDEIIKCEGISRLFNEKKIAIIKHLEGADIIYKVEKEGLQTGVIAERINNESIREPYIDKIGKDGYLTILKPNEYEVFKDFFLPTLVSEPERKLLLSVLQLFNFPNQKYMDSFVYGRRESLSQIVDKYNSSKESELVIRTTLIQELKWKLETKNVWTKRNNENKVVFAYLSNERKDYFWVSEKIDSFEPNFIYQPFDFLMLKMDGDYLKALEHVCNKNPAQNGEDLKRYKRTLKSLHASYLSVYEKSPNPNPLIYVEENNEKLVIGSAQNLSVLSGKAKVGKTLLLNEIACSAYREERLFSYSIEISEKKIVYFDTEQSRFHSQMIYERILQTSKKSKEYLAQKFELHNIADKSPSERVDIIEEKVYGDPYVAVLIIDGIVDLVSNYNNPDEVSQLMTRLLKWKDENQVHIIVVIHENKGNSLLRGHLGTELMNKAETIIGVSKSNDIIKMKCKASRNKEFKPLAFKILDKGILEPIEGLPWKENENSITGKEHHKILSTVFEATKEIQYNNLIAGVKDTLAKQLNIRLGDNKIKRLIIKYQTDGLLTKTKRGIYMLSSDVGKLGTVSNVKKERP